MNLNRRLWMQARLALWPLLLNILLGLLLAVLIIFQARLLSLVLYGVFLEGQGVKESLPLLGWMLGVIVLRGAATLGSEVSAGVVSIRVRQQVRARLFKALVDAGPAQSEDEESGELTAVILQGVEALDAYFSQYLPQLVLAALVPLSILISVFPVDWLTGVVFILTLPLIPVFMLLIGQASEALTRRQWTALSRMSAHFLDTLRGLTTLNSLNQSQRQGEKIAAVNETYRQTTMGILRVTFLSALVLELVSTISTAVVAVEIGLRLLYGRMSFDNAFFVLLVAPEFYFPLRLLGQRFHAGMSGVSSARRIFDILDSRKRTAAKRQQGQARPPSPVTCLHFHSVSYAYCGRESEALSEATFRIYSGQVTALVGQSGAGKSTVIKLLLRFIDPLKGEIFLQGDHFQNIPLSSIAAAFWREQVAWVPQRPYLFHDSIAANICLGKPTATLSEIKNAARMAYLDTWIEKLPNRYDTVIEEKGARLSGGEAQRVALARAFLQDSPFLLLDEPTAHLDPEQENLFRLAFQDLCERPLSTGGKRSIIMIAHQMATLQMAGQLIVLKNGRVVETGSHAALMARAGDYFHMVSTGQQSL